MTQPASGEQAIVVKDLTRRFGDFTAVDHITFDVAAGELPCGARLKRQFDPVGPHVDAQVPVEQQEQFESAL